MATVPAKAVDFATVEASESNVSELDFSSSSATKQRAAAAAAAAAQPSDSFVAESHHMSKTLSSLRRAQIEEDIKGIVFPWSKAYNWWWGWLVFCAIFTIFFETYQFAFAPGGLAPFNDASSIIEYFLTAIFLVDIGVSFNLAFYDERDEIVCDRKTIAKRYLRKMFWIDLVGVFPFYTVALAAAGQLGQDTTLSQYLALFRLLHLVRAYRVKQLLEIIQFSTAISLMGLTLIRNFSVALVWTHTAACIMYFISRQYSFDDDETWIGGKVYDLTGFERYCTALYWSVVTFTTVGYGDFSPVNSAEQIWGMIYMLINIVLQAWIIGSITLLIVKNDEKTGLYRDTLETLDQYASIHSFDKSFHKRLKTQLKLDFNNREVADEQVLKYFPTAMRRKVLRRLYLPALNQTSLMQGVRQQFVDAFLTTCSVEIFSPGEEILQRNSISSDLYLLVGGVVELVPVVSFKDDSGEDASSAGALGSQRKSGEFINEVGFFTESPEIDTVRTTTVCKTLTMSRSAYQSISQDHPGSAGKILQNLLASVEKIAEDMGEPPRVYLPKGLKLLRAGSTFFSKGDTKVSSSQQGSEHNAYVSSEQKAQKKAQLTAIEDLVRMHINKQKDDHTTKFLFAASRGDISTICLMCDQGFDPNSSDYDQRTALMVAAMAGNTDVVSKLLEYGSDPNLTDMHGSSALYEAARNGNEATMSELLKNGAKLCMDDSLAASVLCQAVFDGDVPLLRRLLRANIQVNAADYDKRTAQHIAAAEGNISALKALVEFDADLTAKDRWGKTVDDEARTAKAAHLNEFLKEHKKNKK